MRMSARNLVAAAATAAPLPGTVAATVSPAHSPSPGAAHPVTPIRHLVVLFQENVSFDHYFGTYPHAANSDGHPFHAKPRLPFLLISPYARRNYVDGAVTDQTSVLRFIEDNWLGGQRIGSGSFDTLAGSLDGMFNWRKPHFTRLILDPRTGEPRG